MVRTPLLTAAAAVALTAGRALAATTSSATVEVSQVGPSTYHYDVTLTNAADSATPIGTFWYAWVPGKDFMGTSPTNVASPTGWVDAITHFGSSDGYAIQWKDTVAAGADDVLAGQTAEFSYDSADVPSVEFGNSPFFSTTPTLTSFTYSSDTPTVGTADQFVVTPVPEPTMAALAIPGLLLMLRRRGRAGE